MKKVYLALATASLVVTSIAVALSAKTNKENELVFGELQTSLSTGTGSSVSVTNEDSSVCSKMYYQVSDEVGGKSAVRFLVAINSINTSGTNVPDVIANWHFEYTPSGKSKKVINYNAENAYRQIKVGSETINPDDLNNSTKNYTYNAFVTYTLRNISSSDYKTPIDATVNIIKAADESSVGVVACVTPFSAIIGNTSYEKLEEAVEASNEDDTITAYKDFDLTEYVPDGKQSEYTMDLSERTLDLNGHTITSTNYGVEYKLKNSVIKNGNFVAANGGAYAIFAGGGSSNYSSIENITTTGGINICNNNVILTGENTAVSGAGYYAVWADTMAHIVIKDGSYSSSSSGKAVLGTANSSNNSSIIIEGGTFTSNNSSGLFVSGSQIDIIGGTFNKDPSAYVSSNCTVTKNPNKEEWVVTQPSDKKIFVEYYYYGSPKFKEYLVDKSNLDTNGKIIGGSYTFSEDFAEDLIADGYIYLYDSWAESGVVVKSNGRSTSNSSIDKVSLKVTISDSDYVIYYSSLSDCLAEIAEFGATIITLKADQTFEGNFTSNYTLNGSYYTLTVIGKITAGTFNCKVSADAIDAGTFSSTVTAKTINGGTFNGSSVTATTINGGSFKYLPTGQIASGKYYKFESNMYSLTNDISSYDCYFVSGSQNVYAMYTSAYNETGLTLLKDVNNATVGQASNEISLNGHTLTMTHDTLCSLVSKDSSKAFITSKSNVSNSELINCYIYSATVVLSNYPIADGHSYVYSSSYKYIVNTSDLSVNSKLYKGYYSFTINSGIVETGYEAAYLNPGYVVGKDIIIENNKVSSGVFEMDPSSYIDSAISDVAYSDGKWTVTLKSEKIVAKIGDYAFTDLLVAVASNKLQNEGTITLQKDATITDRIYVLKKITIDLNNHTITHNSTGYFLYAYNSSTNVTFTNGTITTTSANYLIYFSSNGPKVTFDNITLNCSKLFNKYTGLTIKTGTYSVNPTSFVDTTVYDVIKIEGQNIWTVTEKQSS